MVSKPMYSSCYKLYDTLWYQRSLSFLILNHSLAVVGVPLIPTFAPRKSFTKRYKQVIQSPGNDDVVIHADKKSDDDHGETKTWNVKETKLKFGQSM